MEMKSKRQVRHNNSQELFIMQSLKTQDSSDNNASTHQHLPHKQLVAQLPTSIRVTGQPSVKIRQSLFASHNAPLV